ncbi:DUF2993 domain-containing protein [Streptomyces sp. SID13666]|uniref:LmeA family phospholipid-binding protein n=1 Tax=unclassified Streptomyces TaxID=2593676 RepID=UPI0013C035A3|nr:MULTISPECIES: DUF2993 domain-containing protein [unclassified Streptomyces]NEA56693.1 DUF2993 domain-containing protein [Streptomyces sp. SID13666]NEA73137.1 DUF2993 domain-containing protein [Streptomyces sp. SID13588]
MRAARILLIVLVVLGGLFVAADRIAVSVAQDKAAERAQLTQGLSSKPDISIKGFPFLTQVASDKLDDVKITAHDIQAGTGAERLRIDSFTADLRGVNLSGDYQRAVADTADGSAFITYADLSAAAPPGVTVAYGGESKDGKGRVKVTGSVSGVPVLGTVKRSVTSVISVEHGDTVRLHADVIPGVGSIPGLDKLIREKIDFTRSLVGLPTGIKVQSVVTTPSGISVAASGTNVVLAG